MSLEILLAPPIAFVLYLVLVGVLSGVGRVLAGPGHATAMKSSTYSSGEAAPTRPAAPGYKPFFVIALFFAILHLGILILGSGTFTPIAGVYLAGLVLALLALILG
jgi:NADH:ubiquinone oxidoreductase subunit 3 (subunit A)